MHGMADMNDPESMASSTVLTAAKKELRSIMKKNLSKVSEESILSQSTLRQASFLFKSINLSQVTLSSRLSRVSSHIKTPNELASTFPCLEASFRQMQLSGMP